MSRVDPNSISMPTRWQVGDVGVAITALVLAIILAIQMLSINTGIYDAMSTDDTMRLVGVRDLLNGQGWYDLRQHRLNPPGVLMHWSRLIDLPLAATNLVLEPFLGRIHAEAIALFLWPTTLFILILLLTVGAARQMSDGDVTAQVAAVILALLARPALIQFRPGAIDHHNAQNCLLLALLLFASRVEKRTWSAALAGLAASLSLTIGLETLPVIAAISIAVAGLFVWRGAPVARPVGAYAMVLAATSILLALALLPRSSLGAPVCDSLGGPVLLLTVGGGVGLALMVAVDRYWTGLWNRLATATVVSVSVFGAFGSLFSGCLASPYATLDPLVVSLWLDKVQETVSLATMFRLGPEEIPGFYAFPLIAIGLAAVALVRSAPSNRFRWIVAVLALTTQYGISIWQMRGTSAASMMAAPIFAAAALCVWPTFAIGRNLIVLALTVSPTAFVLFGIAVKPLTDSVFRTKMSDSRPETQKCTGMSDIALLRQLPKGRVMAPIDFGPAILAETDHDIFAAPYHRDDDGNLAMLKLMLAPMSVAQQILIDRSVDYIVVCRVAPNQDFTDLAPNGLEARLSRNEIPEFLKPIDLGPSAKISAWRVLK
jgi:hypothetical protein